MYGVTVSGRFRATHAVRQPDGRMEADHEHDWLVEVSFEGPDVNPDGFLVDFVVVQQRLAPLIQALDGARLNDHPFLKGAPASTENLARQLHDALSAYDWGPAGLSRVQVHEAAGCSACYHL